MYHRVSISRASKFCRTVGFKEKQHRNMFSHHTGRLAKFGWILTYLKISLEMALTQLLPGAFQLSSSVQAGPKWLFRSDFPSCSESAELWHVYSLCVKKCPCGFFFQECKNIWTKLCQIQPPLPLCRSPNNVEFRSLRAKTLCMCLLR